MKETNGTSFETTAVKSDKRNAPPQQLTWYCNYKSPEDREGRSNPFFDLRDKAGTP